MTNKTREKDVLGQMLTSMGWVDAEKLEHVIHQARDLDQPMGRALVAHGLLSEQELRNVIEAQAYVRDGCVSSSVAKRAVECASWCGVTLEVALLWVHPGDRQFRLRYENRLGELLIASGAVKGNVVAREVEAGRTTGVQLGRRLVARGHVSENLVTTALEAQRLLRANLVDRQQVISSLKVVRLGLRRQRDNGNCMVVPLGQLFMDIGLVSPADVDDALEVSRINGQPLGQVLLIFALLSERILNAALEIQSLMRSGRIGRKTAVRALSLVFSENLDVRDAISIVLDESREEDSISVSAFLELTGLFEGCRREIKHIEMTTSRSRDQLPRLASFVDDVTLRSAVRCTFLLRRGVLTLEQALLAFHSCLVGDSDIDEFLARADWVLPETLARSNTGPQIRKPLLHLVSAA